MSLHVDYAEISRHARRIVDANRAKSVVDQSDGPTPSRKRVKYTRSTAGCLSCRKHKIKCDEVTPACLRCVAAQRLCEYPPPKEAKRPKLEEQRAESSSADHGIHPSSSLAPSLSPSAIPTPDLSFLDSFLTFTSPPNLPTVEPSPRPVRAPSDSRLPQLVDIHKSTLLNRRAGKVRAQQHIMPAVADTPLAVMHPRLLVVESLLHAFAFDDTLFEFGPSHRSRSLAAAPLVPNITSLDVLSTAFPSPAARTLFQYYCNTTSRLLITMGNIGPNPLLALCTQKLLDTSSASAAAIRMSMLSISVGHLAHETQEAVGAEALGETWVKQRDMLKQMSAKFKRAAVANILMASRTEGDSALVDNILAACTLLCIHDVLMADPTWRENLEHAIHLIAKRGGPKAMLQDPASSFTRRYFLENLAAHDVFACFITGKEPALLGNYDAWWFDSVETSQNRWEWESVERTFGISRAMVDLIARVATLDSQKRRLGVTLHVSPDDDMWDMAQHFVRESHCLLLELDIWGNSLSALPQHVRVTCGDYIYKYMATVFILADILEQPSSSPRIIKAVANVLELLSEATAMRMSVNLGWPLLIAGTYCLGDTRWKARELVDAFKPDYCDDMEAIGELLEEQWRCIDAGMGKQSWEHVMRRIGKFVLVV